MKIRLEILGEDGNSNFLKDLVEPAFKRKGFASYNEFAQLISEHTKSSLHAEVAGISRVMIGQTNRLDPERATAYAKVLGIPEKSLMAFAGAVGRVKKSKPIILDDSTNVTVIVKKLAQRQNVTLEDLVKEFLYMEQR